MKRAKRAARSLLSALLAVLLLGAELSPGFAVTQAEIDALKKDAGVLKSQKQQLQNKINALSGDISTTTQKKELLDNQISVIVQEVENIKAQIALYEEQIAQTEAELADAQEREKAQYELFCTRVRAMEEQGKEDYWSVLFRATSFTDLLTRLDFISEIMDADQRVIDDLRALQAEIADKQARLEEEKAESEAAKAEQLERKAELDKQREAANQLILDLKASRAEAQEDMDDLSAEEDAVQEEILRLSKKLAEEEEARRKAEEARRKGDDTAPIAGASSGGYIWPVSSRYVTSTFGGRASPGGIGSTNHKGIDIGRVGYDTQIYAAKAGTVIVSQYSRSYGNYVVVSHGSGNTTLYAHMSSRSVSVGTRVSQGAVLGITGSTGNSTGPHLHFEITENGSRVNPLNYLSGYTLAG